VAYQRRRRIAKSIAAAELVIASAALTGGTLLAIRPDGALLAADPAVLRGTPFSDWQTPGVLLVILVGGVFLVTSIAEWLGRRLAAALSVAAGVGLVVFELVQMVLIGWQVLQAVLGLAGLVLAAVSIGRAGPAAHQPRRVRTTGTDQPGVRVPTGSHRDVRLPAPVIGAGPWEYAEQSMSPPSDVADAK
jgi:hypothetical protein